MTKTKGTKKTTRRTAATKRGKATETVAVPRTAKQLAAGIQRRLTTSPRYWVEVVEAMNAWAERQAAPRAAQVEHATH